MNDLQQKIKNYTKTAAVLLSSSSVANGAIIYTDISPDTTLIISGTIYNIDLDNNSSADFGISWDSLTSFSSVGIQNFGSNNFYAATSGTNYATVLSSGALISNSNMIWGTDSGVGYRDNIGWYSKSSGSSNGYWAGQSNQFIGVKFDIAGSTHFGWIRISVPTGYSSVTIHDFAYNDCSNDPIVAGIMSGGGACLQAPMVFDSIRCDTGMITLNATPANGGITCNWYESDTSSVALSQGLSFTTSIFGDTSFFVTTVDSLSNESVARSEVLGEVNSLPTPLIFTTGSDLQTFNVYEFYQWYLNNNSISGADTTIYTPTQNGDYHVEVTDSIGCVGASSIKVISSFIDDTKIEEELLNSVKIFPNPSSKVITLERGNSIGILSITIYNTRGQKLYENVIMENNDSRVVDISEFSKGVYFVKVSSPNGINIEKLIIE